MAYVKPQVLVHQEFRLVPTELTDPLRAFIVGPQARLHRYGLADEKPAIGLGTHNRDNDTVYAWPAKAVGSRIDLSYVKLILEGALLRYFQDAVGVDSTLAPVPGRPNRIRSSSVVWKASPDGQLSEVLLGRDVRLGDHARITGLGSDNASHTLDSYVVGFAGESTAASIAAATAGVDNATAQGFATSIDQIAGAQNSVQIDLDASGYDGRPDGTLDEFYTVEVTTASAGGDLKIARLRVTSASGLDNVTSVTPEDQEVFFPIGTRGLNMTFRLTENTSNSSEAAFEGVSPDDLVIGQKWRIHVVQDFTPATAASGGTYTGSVDATYIIRVSKGGAFGNDPEVMVGTTTGVDASGPTKVTAADTAVAVGTSGLTVSFSGAGLSKDDLYYVSATAVGTGALQTLILAHNLPDELIATTDLAVELFIKKNLQVLPDRTGFAPELNWVATQDDFTVKSGLMAYDAGWAVDGTPQAMDALGGELFLEYREWVTDHVGRVGSLDDVAGLADALGTNHPDNPLAYGVFKALSNSNGTAVHYTAVQEPISIDSWVNTLELVAGQEGVYGLVPLTHDHAVQELFAAHVSGQSTAEVGLWRSAFVSLLYPARKVLIDQSTSDDGLVVLATVQDDPQTAGTQNTLLKLTSANADLLATGVQVGDTVRFLFTTDGFGNSSYTEFTVAGVLTTDSLLLVSGHSQTISVGQKVELWRTLTRTEVAQEVGLTAASFANRRVCAVIPDFLPANGLVVGGYYLCAALAGLRSGVVPHQGLTHLEVRGFDRALRATQFFSSANLDSMAEKGVWIVITDPNSGVLYTRHATTTSPASLSDREEMIRANVDSISYLFQKRLQPFIGKANVTPTALRVINTTLQSTISFLKSSGFTETLGGQLIAATINRLSVHEVFKDRVVATIRLTVPAPINNVEVFLVV